MTSSERTEKENYAGLHARKSQRGILPDLKNSENSESRYMLKKKLNLKPLILSFIIFSLQINSSL